ncbi:uncharacterized protein LOC134814369 [Bolinopsis microptera]|uniref:uncharacterized protein LOC134814369 n=1 Tax=Bolinopsis microptera TaxID=2820187 RepID=UPI003079BA17
MEFPEPHILNRSLENGEDGEGSQPLSEIQHNQGARIQTILAFAEGSINLVVSTFVILSIVCFRRKFKNQIKLYFNMVVACFCAGLYQVTSRAVTLVFHYSKHPNNELIISLESELVDFPPCIAVLYFWILTRDLIFLSTVPITLDRILAVSKPHSYKRYSTNRFFSGTISLSWVATGIHVGATALATLFTDNRIFLSQHTLQCTFQHHHFSVGEAESF